MMRMRENLLSLNLTMMTMMMLIERERENFILQGMRYKGKPFLYGLMHKKRMEFLEEKNY
jgi:hypothetical protein